MFLIFCFKLPSGVLSLLQYNSVPSLSLCYYVFVIYICFLYIISPTIQLYNYYFIQLSFKSVKRRKEGNIFVVSFIFICTITFFGALYFFIRIRVTVWYHFLSPWRISFNIFYEACLLATSSHSLSGSLFSSPFSKDTFIGYRFLVWLFCFLSALWLCHPTPPGLHCFRCEISC